VSQGVEIGGWNKERCVGRVSVGQEWGGWIDGWMNGWTRARKG
jgi:hypothetical protein